MEFGFSMLGRTSGLYSSKNGSCASLLDPMIQLDSILLILVI